MARTLTSIYTEAKETRDKYLEQTEYKNSSKMSIMDAFTWVVAACIWTFDNLLDVFQIDIVNDLSNRINGTPAYYINSILKFQNGDDLVMNEEGTSFSYPIIDENKRIITCASYSEYSEEGFYDKVLVLKVAKGQPGSYERLSEEELIKARAYINQIKFAGTNIDVISRKGDVLIPKVTVYHDGAETEDVIYTNITNALNEYIASIKFDGYVYAQKVIDAIQKAEHVVDVYYDATQTDHQGVFIAQYNDDGNLIESDGKVENRIERYVIPNSGYIRESTGEGDEENLSKWRESIILKVEGDEV